MLSGTRVQHNAAMPRVARPVLPPLVEEAVDTVGSRVRVAVLKALNEQGPRTKAELHRLLGGSESNLAGHLRALEQVGAITARPTRADEPAPVIRRYEVDQERVRVLAEALVEVVLVRPTEIKSRS